VHVFYRLTAFTRDATLQTEAEAYAKYAAPQENAAFAAAIKPHCAHWSTTTKDRVFHSHGHTAQEVYML
jgi:hypothetical protein